MIQTSALSNTTQQWSHSIDPWKAQRSESTTMTTAQTRSGVDLSVMQARLLGVRHVKWTSAVFLHQNTKQADAEWHAQQHQNRNPSRTDLR